MKKSRLTIIVLVVALVATNVWWAYQLLDAGLTQTYRKHSVDVNKAALSEALVLLPVASRTAVSREEIIEAARESVPYDSEPFEKDGYVWIGYIGLKFDRDGRIIDAVRSWES